MSFSVKASGIAVAQSQKKKLATSSLMVIDSKIFIILSSLSSRKYVMWFFVGFQAIGANYALQYV